MNPAIAYISAGSNIGDRKKNLDYALEMFEKPDVLLQINPRDITLLQISHYYETEPVGVTDHPWYLNIAIKVETMLSPRGLLELCMKIEESRGRERPYPQAPRTLDLDILFYDDAIVCEEDLIIPHPRLTERKFVLTPIADIAPDFVHPLLHKSMRTLLKECKDNSWVRMH